MYEIIEYNNEYEKTWDDFVENTSINGTFLQERRFLNYHPQGRFQDASLMVFYKGKLEAVIPACKQQNAEKKIFNSHAGSTYGGIVISRYLYKADKVLGLINEVEQYISKQKYTSILYKPTMNLLCNPKGDLLSYCLGYCGYKEYKELNIYVNYANYNPDILSNLSKMKQRIIKKCEKTGVVVKEFDSKEEIKIFHDILTQNLKKYNKTPVHTVEELIDLKKNRLTKEIRFLGAYLDGKMIAGTMIFEFHKYKCAHTQYLAADPEYNKLSPMSYIYYKTAEFYYYCHFEKLSWGISTEDNGTKINMGLTTNKEEYGSEYNLVTIYEKEL